MPKRILQGVVTSDKNEQTITVLVERRFKHPLLQKTVRSTNLADWVIAVFKNPELDDSYIIKQLEGLMDEKEKEIMTV